MASVGLLLNPIGLKTYLKSMAKNNLQHTFQQNTSSLFIVNIEGKELVKQKEGRHGICQSA